MILILFIFGCLISVKAQRNFIVNYSECSIPYFDPFTDDTRPIYFPFPYHNCSSMDPLTYTKVENNTGYLKINNAMISQYYSPDENMNCCFSYIRRKQESSNPDSGVSISPCQNFNDTTELNEPFVKVSCYLYSKIIYENTHAIITKPTNVQSKIEQCCKDKKPLSVLIIVIDSMSKLNFKRTMAETAAFLEKNNFVTLLGYNKIAEYTFPNFNALFTGLSESQSNEVCNKKNLGALDKCPLIWYEYGNNGYATAYAEDWPSAATYSFQKGGFQNPPTDYYFKPYLEASQDLGTEVVEAAPYCSGPESQGERILGIATEFALSFKELPSFGVFRMNTFSRHNMNSPTRMDLQVKLFLEKLKWHGVLNDSMVVLLSDHGNRYGKIRETVQGWYEERLPMHYISLPHWFIEKYPKKYQNLKINSKILTTPYDFYMTLQDILAMSTENFSTRHSLACHECQSLFEEIPYNRDCTTVGIKEELCTCIGKFSPVNKKISHTLLNKAIFYIKLSKLVKTKITQVRSLNVAYYKNKAYVLMIFKTLDLTSYQALFTAPKNRLDKIKLTRVVSIKRSSM